MSYTFNDDTISIVDGNLNQLAVSQSQIINSSIQSGFIQMGVSGSTVLYNRLDSQGNTIITGSVNALRPDVMVTGIINTASSFAVIPFGSISSQTAVNNSIVILPLVGHSTAIVQIISGTFGGAVLLEGTVDGVNWGAIQGQTPGLALPAYYMLTNTSIKANVSGYSAIRLRAYIGTTFAPSITVVIKASHGDYEPDITLVGGQFADGTPMFGYPVVTAGTDGTNVRTFSTDNSGKLNVNVTGSVGITNKLTLTSEQIPSGTLPQNLVVVGGYNLKNNRIMPVRIDENGFVITKESEGEATFSVIASSSIIALNKSMISILNTSSTAVIKIREIFITNVQTTTATGIVAVFEMRRMSAHSAGAQLTPSTHDTIDALNVGVTVRTGGTVTGEGPLFDRFQWSTDEWGPGALDTEAADHAPTTIFPNWSSPAGNVKPLVLRQNQGLTVKQITNSTAGTFDIVVVFTQEDN